MFFFVFFVVVVVVFFFVVLFFWNSIKGNNSYNYLFASLSNITLPIRSLLLKLRTRLMSAIASLLFVVMSLNFPASLPLSMSCAVVVFLG